MAGKGGEIARWDNHELEYLIEEVEAKVPDRRTNAMLTQQQKYGEILERMNNMFHSIDLVKSTRKSLAQLVTKLGKTKAEPKKKQKTKSNEASTGRDRQASYGLISGS